MVILSVAFALGCENDLSHVNRSWSQAWLDSLAGLDRSEGSTALVGTPCPAALCSGNAAYVDSLCRTNVPRSGRIWFENGEDGPECWCACSALETLGPLSLDSLVAGRKERDKAIVAARLPEFRLPTRSPSFTKKKAGASAPDTTSVAGIPKLVLSRKPRLVRLVRPSDTLLRDLPSPPPPPVGSAHASTAEDGPVCERYPYDLPMGSRTVSFCELVSLFEEAYPVFRIQYTESGWFPTTVAPEDLRSDFGSDGSVDYAHQLVIEVPEEFIAADAVGAELVAFMLAHEIGHGLADPDPCTAEYFQVCEGGADHWGAAYCLRTVFDHRFVEVSRAAQRQLREYYFDLGLGMSDCGDRWCGDCTETESCAHPPLECRLKIIKQARRADLREAACSMHWAELEEGCEPCPGAVDH